ncbi:unnamed protein product [Leptidea sinapis]|uniref:Uncharacterized protein n=1 Tax=Leptidea sinapis TaxID=189913 RepID=A0A5E4PN80_9NEOP|nr:unnamed protein product [Leptidea sinapis]
MIGAMPAVAVRHERRRVEKRSGGRRPSQLPLQLGRGVEEASPSPDRRCTTFLHAVVGSLVLGIVVLVVGLVQLSPGAEAAQYRFYLMGAGAALIGSGILGTILRCYCIHIFDREYNREYREPGVAQPNQKQVGVVDPHDYKHKLKTQPSMSREAELTKQPSAGSET